MLSTMVCALKIFADQQKHLHILAVGYHCLGLPLLYQYIYTNTGLKSELKRVTPFDDSSRVESLGGSDSSRVF